MRTRSLILASALLLALAGCSGGAYDGSEPGPGPTPPGPVGSGSDAGTSIGGDGTFGEPGAPREGGADSGSIGGGEGGSECLPEDGCITEVPAGQLTAGEWRDLDDWDLWLELMGSEAWSDMEGYWGYHTTSRIPVRVSSGSSAVVDAEVDLLDADGNVVWAARSDSQGRAELFASVFAESTGAYTVRVTALDGASATRTGIDPTVVEPVAIELATASAPAPSLDLMFVIDTTGSMGDELWYIQAELADVVTRAQARAEQEFDLRLSLNFYRDQGDDYVVNSHPFTRNLSEATTWLSRESAGGGGDFPEAVDRALADAIDGHAWRDEATARLLFLVLDAPPHHEDAQAIERLRQANQAAAERGVKIIPVSGSGIDKQTEFLMRFLAVTTNGSYTFLTSHSGIGGDHIDPTTGAFKVEFLNDLLVRIIAEEVSPG